MSSTKADYGEIWAPKNMERSTPMAFWVAALMASLSDWLLTACGFPQQTFHVPGISNFLSLYGSFGFSTTVHPLPSQRSLGGAVTLLHHITRPSFEIWVEPSVTPQLLQSASLKNPHWSLGPLEHGCGGLWVPNDWSWDTLSLAALSIQGTLGLSSQSTVFQRNLSFAHWACDGWGLANSQNVLSHILGVLDCMSSR